MFILPPQDAYIQQRHVCLHQCSKCGPICRYTAPELIFVPEFQTGTYEYTVYRIHLSFSFFWRYILLSFLRSIPALLNFHFEHWSTVNEYKYKRRMHRGKDVVDKMYITLSLHASFHLCIFIDFYYFSYRVCLIMSIGHVFDGSMAIHIEHGRQATYHYSALKLLHLYQRPTIWLRH
jgi:hypothetical protein